MTTRVKRTYNLSEAAVRRVRELASDYGAADSQDAVVELAVDRLYRAFQDAQEAMRWASAATDPAFRREITSIQEAMGDGNGWPT
jgi:hypothetical protein